MSEFDDYVFTKARAGILSVPDEPAADVYALSFYRWALDDDPRMSVLSVGYNTDARRLSCTPTPGQPAKWPIASDPGEAKWNYAFWLQEEGEVCVIGESDEDEMACRAWIESRGWMYTDNEYEEDFEYAEAMADQITAGFVELCVSVAKRLHDEGVISTKFGRPVPIIVHELEYSDAIAEATDRANPLGVSAEFTRWVAQLGGR